MHLNPRIDSLSAYPFKRLADLLAGIEPVRADRVNLTIGEPQFAPPPAIASVVSAHAHLWNKYPPNTGTPEFRAAAASWLSKRFSLPIDALDPERSVVPCSGTREGLFMLGLAACPEAKAGKRPVIAMPNPFYHVYETAANIAGAEAVFLSAEATGGFLPALDAIKPDLLDRIAVFFLCSPANPQGTIAPTDYLSELIRLARKHDFVVAFDECYSEVYTGAPPPGGLGAALAVGPGPRGGWLDNVVVFHSLSKRSSAPGLRSGFMAGDPELVSAFARLVGSAGVPTPLPLLAAATALWSDEEHVETYRAAYRENFRAAERHFGSRGWRAPGGGFYLWLDVGDGEAVAQRLWRDGGIRVMPGAYMARGTGAANPGHRYIRAALVHPPQVTADALARVAALL
ncbi:MAG: aminotransferase class I/II-fold pyridoxal phosphate-dependent enzyme [Alphaproteobacteria bacterium]|nr:aminotransferase class I/II-fold pyridoxal phosphate-dependent enzyme [Alphaproteobacteria bacterium]